MQYQLTKQQHAKDEEFRSFVALHVEPDTDAWEREQAIPGDVISMLSKSGYLGNSLPRDYGGQGWDIVTFGLLNEAFGRGSSSLTSVLTVQAMVSMALLKWGTHDQKQTWLPRLASGEIIAAFALTEPSVGSDLQSLTTTFTRRGAGDVLVLNGTKRWITCAQRAGLFLVFGKLEQQPVACLVPRETPGMTVEPIRGLLGFRAAGLAQISFNNVEVPMTNLVGKPGFALSHIAPVGLHYGRISTACSALGLLRGCLEETVAYAGTRKIGERGLGEIGMIRSMIARMGVDLQAAKLLCHNACLSADDRAPEAFEHALVAKYFTSRAAVKAASDAVQTRGAAGCHESSPTSRYYCCAKIMEIIEGTTQIHEELLGEIFVGRAVRHG